MRIPKYVVYPTIDRLLFALNNAGYVLARNFRPQQDRVCPDRQP